MLIGEARRPHASFNVQTAIFGAQTWERAQSCSKSMSRKNELTREIACYPIFFQPHPARAKWFLGNREDFTQLLEVYKKKLYTIQKKLVALC